MTRGSDPSSGPDPDAITFFETDGGSTTVDGVARVGSARTRRLALGLTGLVAVALVVATVRRDDPPPTPVAAPVTVPAETVPEADRTETDRADTDDVVEAAGPSAIVPFDDDGTPILFGPSNRNTFFTQPYAIVRAPGDDRLHRVTLGLNGIETVTLPTVERGGLDAEGRMVALVSVQGALLAGPVDGNLSTIATGVTSFAWHDQEPSRLAFITQSNPDAVPDRHEFVIGEAPQAVLPGRPAPGTQLLTFGAWGDAYRVDDVGLIITSPDGAQSVETEGRVLGGLGTTVAVARPRPGGTTRIPDDHVQQISFRPDGPAVLDVPSAALHLRHLDLGDRSLTAAVLVDPGPLYRIQVTDETGEVVLKIDDVAGPLIDFSVDGIGLAFLSTTPGFPIGLANLSTGQVERYAAPELAGTGQSVTVIDVRVE